tara:strand:- start:1268 stop:1537 length:270 start_codon:yes stop_codon:yes gene_type:complete
MMASRGMGDISPSKMPRGKRKARRDDTDFTQYAKGGWIKEAIKKPGALREALGAKAGQPIPTKKLAAAANKPGKMGQRARLAQTLKGMK